MIQLSYEILYLSIQLKSVEVHTKYYLKYIHVTQGNCKKGKDV